jgi:hypothetical protein
MKCDLILVFNSADEAQNSGIVQSMQWQSSPLLICTKVCCVGVELLQLLSQNLCRAVSGFFTEINDLSDGSQKTPLGGFSQYDRMPSLSPNS